MALRKRMSRKELQKTDPVTAALEEFFENLMKYRRPLILAGTAIFVILALAIGYRQWSDAQAVELANSVSATYAVVGAAVGNDETQPVAGQEDLRMRFAKTSEKEEAIKEKVGILAEKYGQTNLALVAQVLNSAVDSKDGSLAEFGGAREKLMSGEPVLADWLSLTMGRVAWDSGDSAAASTEFGGLVQNETASVTTKALAQIYAGDLQNPAFVKNGDTEKARKSYRACLALIDTSVESRSGVLDGLRSEAALRLALLPGGSAEKLSPASDEKPPVAAPDVAVP